MLLLFLCVPSSLAFSAALLICAPITSCAYNVADVRIVWLSLLAFYELIDSEKVRDVPTTGTGK